MIRPAALPDQGGDLLRRQPVAGSHRRVTGHQAQQIVEELFPIRRSLLANQVIHDGAEDPLR